MIVAKEKKFQFGFSMRIILAVLFLGAFGVSCKMLLAGFPADEEYQLVMSYRLAMGDRLFTEVWDTLQTSGFLSAILIKAFIMVTGNTTGIVVFLRMCGLVFQFLCSLFLFITLTEYMKKVDACLISLSFYCIFTKLIAMPDFSNMQMWSLTTMLCMISSAVCCNNRNQAGRRNLWLMLAAVFYCMAFLSTACAILVPVIAIFLYWLFHKKQCALVANGIFWGTCCFLGLMVLGYVVWENGSIVSVLENMDNIILGDSTHMSGINIVGQSKWLTYLKNLVTVSFYLAATALLSCVIVRLKNYRRKDDFWPSFSASWICLAMGVTLYKWIIRDEGYDGLKIFIPVIVIVGIVYCVMGRHERKQSEQYLLSLFGICIFIGAFINVLLISNVPLINNLSFLYGACVWGMMACVFAYRSRNLEKLLTGLVVTFCCVVMFGSGYTLLGGAVGNNVFALNGIVRNGPAENCLMSKEAAWVYHTDYEIFENVIAPKSNVLIITDYFKNTSVTSCYLLNQVEISHYSVNSTPTFSEKLEEYWKLYPWKQPDVVMVNTHAVTLHENDWATGYLKREFDVENYIHTENADFYFRLTNG